MITEVVRLTAFMQIFSFGDVLQKLEDLGLFEFILPFLLIFAIVYGVLSWTKIFGDQRGIHAIIALVIGFLAIRWPVYRDFLTVISPKLGVGLVVILVLVLLIGLFVPEKSQAILGWIMMAIGVIIFIIILAQTYSDLDNLGYGQGLVTEDLVGWVVIVALLIGVIVAVVVGNTARDVNKSSTLGRLFKEATGGG